MAIAHTIEQYLMQHKAAYELLVHPHTGPAYPCLSAAHAPEERVAKAVLLEDEWGLLVALLPSNRNLDLSALNRGLQRNLAWSTEARTTAVFADCASGVTPVLGPAYGIETVLDESLSAQPDVYFDAGDGQELIHLSRDQFLALLNGTRRGRFSRDG